MKIFEENLNLPQSGGIRRTLDEAFRAGTVKYNPVDFTQFSPLPGVFGTHADLLKHAVINKESGDKVIVVTVDPAMRQGAGALGVEVVDTRGLRDMIVAALQAEKDAAAEAEKEKNGKENPSGSMLFLA
jgi:hypothetical protein